MSSSCIFHQGPTFCLTLLGLKTTVDRRTDVSGLDFRHYTIRLALSWNCRRSVRCLNRATTAFNSVIVSLRGPHHHLETFQQSFPPNACFAYTLDPRKRLNPNGGGLRTSSTSSRPFVQTATSNIIAISMRNVGRSIRPQMTLVRMPSLKASWRSRRQFTVNSARSRSRRFFLSTSPSSMLSLVKCSGTPKTSKDRLMQI